MGSVLVCTTVLVTEDCVLLLDVLELPGEGEMVCTPPPTVETMVRPTLFVLVITWPRVREAEEAVVGEGDSPGVDAVELESTPGTTAPLDEVLVDVVVGVLEPAPAGVAPVSVLELEVVLEEDSPP